jgi:hypothetical protein
MELAAGRGATRRRLIADTFALQLHLLVGSPCLLARDGASTAAPVEGGRSHAGCWRACMGCQGLPDEGCLVGSLECPGPGEEDRRVGKARLASSTALRLTHSPSTGFRSGAWAGRRSTTSQDRWVFNQTRKALLR